MCYTALCVTLRCALHRAVCCTHCVLHRAVMWFQLRISEKCFTHTSQLNCLPFSFLLCSPSSLSSSSFILPCPSSLLFLLSLYLPPSLSFTQSTVVRETKAHGQTNCMLSVQGTYPPPPTHTHTCTHGQRNIALVRYTNHTNFCMQ